MTPYPTNLPGLELVKVDRVRDAIGALCPECPQLWTAADPVPWHWSNSRNMHRRGTGHKTILVAIVDRRNEHGVGHD